MDTRIRTAIVQEIVNREELNNFIKFEDENPEEDLLIYDMIAAVRAHFEKRTGLSFIEKTYETLFLYNDKPYILPVSPIISVDKVELMDYQGVKTELTLNSEYYKRGLYQIEICTSEVTGWPNPFISFDSYYDLLVMYKAGYGSSITEKLPADLLSAMKMQIKQWYDNRDDFFEFKILGSIDKILGRYKMKVI